MYKAYTKEVSGQSQSQSESPVDISKVTIQEKELETNDEVNNVVENAWTAIDAQCKASENRYLGSKQRKGWQVVRVFVSSTFADFFNEREVLVKKVFPELREWCYNRKLKLIECDLRWGVPKDTSTGDTIAICLEEIDKGMLNTNAHPLFVTLMGSRYGWIPPMDQVPVEIVDKYQWVPGTSITSMEIMHGAYRIANPNACFLFRSEDILKGIPDVYLPAFSDSDFLSQCHLKKLKEKLKTKFPKHCYYYTPKFKQISDMSGKDRVELCEMDEFATQVTNFLKDAIDRTFPYDEQAGDDVFEQDEEYQKLCLESYSSQLVGRQKELQMLFNLASKGDTSGFEKTDSDSASVNPEETENLICTLDAPSGWGMTTLICSMIQLFEKNGLNVFYHLIGSSTSSVRLDFLLKRLLKSLKFPGADNNEELEKNDPNRLQSMLKQALEQYREKKMEKLIIVIDALDVLSSRMSVDHLSWLPVKTPGNIQFIVASSHHPPTIARFYGDHPRWKLTLKPMPVEDLTAIGVTYLSSYSKQLDPGQLKMLMSNTRVDNPLWIKLMVEELRIYGDFRQMNQKIEDMPTSMDQLLVQIIKRLIQEDNELGLVKKVLCLIACSRYGLPAEKVRQILGNASTKEELPSLDWAKVHTTLRPYLRTFGFQEDMIRFSNASVEEAAFKQLLPTERDRISWHAVLADFYQAWCNDRFMRNLHLPYHLAKAKLWKRMVTFMRTDNASSSLAPWQRSNYLKEARCRSSVISRMPMTTPMFLCMFCGCRTGSFNPLVCFPNNMMCVVCGSLCQGPNTGKAYACHMHANSRGKNMVKCTLCNHVVNIAETKPNLKPSPALLCSNCSFGHMQDTCAAFNV